MNVTCGAPLLLGDYRVRRIRGRAGAGRGSPAGGWYSRGGVGLPPGKTASARGVVVEVRGRAGIGLPAG